MAKCWKGQSGTTHCYLSPNIRSIKILLSHSCNKGESWNKKAKWKEEDDFHPAAGLGEGTQWELNSSVHPNWVVSGSTRGTEVRVRLCSWITVKKLFAGSEQSSGLLSDASWINGKGVPGEMHSDCIQASPWLILGNFRLKCSFSFSSSVGPEITCQILTLPQPVNLVICKTQMQTLSLQLHLRSWQTQANWCCLAFSSPSLCSLAFFLLPQSQLSPFAGNFVGDLCPAWSCLPEGGCILPRCFLLKQAFPCPKILFTPNICFHPRCSESHHVPMGRQYELLQVRAVFLQPCRMATEKFRLIPNQKYERENSQFPKISFKMQSFPWESSTWF